MGIKVNWFIPVDHKDYNHMPASVWIRCLQLIPYLEKREIKCTINDIDSNADIDFFVRVDSSIDYDIAKQQKDKGHRIVFDLCVNYLDESAVNDADDRITEKHFADTLRMVELSDYITCASRKIADTTNHFHERVSYISDSVDNKHFRRTKRIQDFSRKKLRAIWSGVHSKACELTPILPVLADLGVELVIISDMPPVFEECDASCRDRFHYAFRKWKYETFPKEIVQGDICVSSRDMTLNYNLGHSLFKVGVFMAQGVPAMVSPQPSYIELMTGDLGNNVCYSLSDWQSKFNQVVCDRNKLSAMSKQSIQAMEPYMTERIIEQYIEIIQKII